MNKLFTRILVISGIFILFGATTFAQVKKFRWSTELCEFEGTYNTKNYTEQKLKNTLRLFSGYGSEFRLETKDLVWKFEDIDAIDVAALDREYEQKSAELKNLDIVNLPYWENLRKKILTEMEQTYNLKRVSMLAYKNPTILKEYKSADKCVQIYADPLINGGGELLDVWLKVNQKTREKNGDPERIRRNFEAQYNSPDKFKYAQIEVMLFGWWNCANESIEYVQQDDTSEKEFKKLFTRTRTIYCDEP